MSKFHYSEKFFSLQAEGRYVGVPSVFLRMFGCNFRCKNFGRDKNEVITGSNPDVAVVIKNIDQYKSIADLPLVKTGCDSYMSIYPEFKRFVYKETADELAVNLVDLLPFKHWEDEHLVITGGEPLIAGWQKLYPDLLENKLMHSLKELTFETNGTQPVTQEFENYLNRNWFEYSEYNEARSYDSLTFSVSPKLSCSGEKREDAIKPYIVCNYENIGFTYLKFVVATEEDVAEAVEVKKIYRDAGFEGPIYLMPAGGTSEAYFLNNKRVAELAMKNGLRYSPRLQVDLFANAWAT